MGTLNQKIKEAEKRNIRIINLNRLIQLLTGKIQSFDDLHKLTPLTKVDFTEAKYERAVAELAVQSMEMDEFNFPTDGELAGIDSATFVSSLKEPAAEPVAASAVQRGVGMQSPPVVLPAAPKAHDAQKTKLPQAGCGTPCAAGQLVQQNSCKKRRLS